MKKLFLLVSVYSCMAAPRAQQVQKQLNELLDAYAKQEMFNGSVLVARNGEVLLDKGFGLQDVNSSKPNSASTQYQVGSVTKQFTSTVILKLQEQGKLSVSDKLTKYFPGYPHGDSITLEQLMHHTSGIYSYTNEGQFMEKEVTKVHTREQMMALFRDKPLDFSPGTKWNYSNSGYCLLGYIIEIVSGKPYESNVRDLIFKPAGMRHSGFDFTNLKTAEKATGYQSFAGKASPPAPIVDSTVSYAAGALYATTGDLYNWTRMVLSKKIISPASWKKSFTAGLNNYGYGWGLDSIGGRPAIQHSGGIHGFNSNLAILPDEKVSIILLSNVNTPLLEEITTKIVAVLTGKPYELPALRKEVSIKEEQLKDYVGEYEISPDFKLGVTLDGGKLMVQATNQQKFDMFAEKPDYFFLKVVDAQLEFNRDANNQVYQVILHQGGKKSVAKKLK